MYNNYGYNPYMNQNRYMGVPQQPQPIEPQQPFTPVQTVQNRSFLNGKQVESIDVVKAMDIPMDGTVSYYPIADGSAIATKQLQMDGTSKTIIYKPIIEQDEEKSKSITLNDLNNIIEKIDLLNEKMESVEKEIKDFKKKK